MNATLFAAAAAAHCVAEANLVKKDVVVTDAELGNNDAALKQFGLSHIGLRRTVSSLIAREIQQSRGTDEQKLRPWSWAGDLRMFDAGLELDSLERVNCASALNEFFHMSDYGAEDYLLAAETLDEWVKLVALSVVHGAGSFTFQTSGSSGEPKRCTHQLKTLFDETSLWKSIIDGRTSVISFVAPHHIYGFLFGVQLPQLLGLPVVDARALGAGRLKEVIVPGALIIGAPVHWQYIARSFLSMPSDVVGVTSSAPMSPQLAQQLRTQHLAELVEVYGSTETGGIGYRFDPCEAYTLLPRWTRAFGKNEEALLDQQTGSFLPLMDGLTWEEPRAFHVTGRRDGAVQIGGNNVFVSRVKDIIAAHDMVADCAVRLDPKSGRLSAFVVLAEGVDLARDGELAQTLKAWCKARMTAAECPTRYDFGAHVPTNEMGKQVAW